jgi:thiol-disulfide isomerase/thioredoxin
MVLPQEGKMRLIRSAVLYTALALGANAAVADTAALEAARQGDMRKMVLAAEPAMIPDGVVLDGDDGEHPLADWRGKYVLMNFWATWCAPCRAEMATLDRLQADLGGDGFEVLTIATGRNPMPAITKFFTEEGIANLPILRDPKQTLARDMGVLGLPVSVLVDPEGREIGRLVGDAEWDSPEAKALIAAAMGR